MREFPGNQQTSTDHLVHLARNIFLKTHRLKVLNCMCFSKLSKRFGPILGGCFQVPFGIYSERQAIRIAVSGPEKLWDLPETAPLIADQS